MTFLIIFLALKYEGQFKSTSRLVKGLTLMHVLFACYVMSYGAGASLNPAFGMAQITYWVGLANTDDLDFYPTLIWVYMTMPFIGAYLAYVIYEFYRDVTAKFLPKSENP
jgi:glycerol uptake facilitator-like aquaporin